MQTGQSNPLFQTLADLVNRGFPYEDAFCRILWNFMECYKSLKHELKSI